MYETSTGDEPYDAYEVVLTVNGQRCAAVLTVVPEERFQAHADEPCSDEAGSFRASWWHSKPSPAVKGSFD